MMNNSANNFNKDRKVSSRREGPGNGLGEASPKPRLPGNAKERQEMKQAMQQQGPQIQQSIHHEAEPPKRIGGKIQLGELLGRGAFGRVYKGLNFQTGEVVAVKQIKKTDLEPSQLPSIMHELELLQQLSHPHIVKFIAYYEVDDYLFFVMEYVENGSLNETMKKFGVFPEELLVLYVAQVLLGLQYLHDQNVIHRDIKGCNLLLTKEGKIKLADFGSCTKTAMDKQYTVVGTPFWMAPEIISVEGGEKVSDVWSLGCTIIELLTGKPPYWDAGAMSALFKMVSCEHPPLPEGISDELRDFLLKCFTRDTTKRPCPSELQKHPWIANNVPSALEVKTPSMEEVGKTVRQYNTLRRPTASSIDWNQRNGQGKREKVDLSGLSYISIGSSRSRGAEELQKQLDEMNTKYQKVVDENKELKEKLDKLMQENDSLEDEIDRLHKRIESQEDELDELRDKLQEPKQKQEKDPLDKDKDNAEKDKPRETISPVGKLKSDVSARKSRQANIVITGHSKRPSSAANSIKNSKDAEKPISGSESLSGEKDKKARELKTTKDKISVSSLSSLPDVGSSTPDALRRQSPRSLSSSALDSIEEKSLSLTSTSSSPSLSAEKRKKRPSKICASCSKPISRDGRLAMGKPWHHDCFKCSQCGKILEEFIEKDAKPYCVPDFNQLFGNRCGGCGEMIQGQYIQAMNRYWHAGHFKCCVCQVVIQGGFVEKGDKPVCEGCFRQNK